MSQAHSTIDFPICDADQHFYEAADSFTRHLDPKFRYAFRSEGLVRPMDFQQEVVAMKPSDVRKVMSDNLRGLLGLAA